MKIKHVISDDCIILENLNPDDFNIKDTFECGQCFRWEKTDRQDGYLGIAHGKKLIVQQNEDYITLHCNEKDFLHIWQYYFDLDTDYDEIKERLRKDDIMNKAICSAPGIRILNQELFETAVSFITSSNSNIKRITRNIKDLCTLLGQPIGDGYYAFPTVEALSNADICTINQCRAGFRCDYIHSSANMIKNMSDSFDKIRYINMGYEETKKELMRLKGVGNKVADCIILFAGISSSAFPTDVWVKRIMQNLYIKKEVTLDYVSKYGRDKFGDLAGYAQQYLFHYARNIAVHK